MCVKCPRQEIGGTNNNQLNYFSSHFIKKKIQENAKNSTEISEIGSCLVTTHEELLCDVRSTV